MRSIMSRKYSILDEALAYANGSITHISSSKYHAQEMLDNLAVIFVIHADYIT